MSRESIPGERAAALRARLLDRLFTTLDLLSILAFDAVILIFAHFIIVQTEHWTPEKLPADAVRFFEVARSLSSAMFLILYLVLACFHVYRFIRSELAA